MLRRQQVADCGALCPSQRLRQRQQWGRQHQRGQYLHWFMCLEVAEFDFAAGLSARGAQYRYLSWSLLA